MSDRDDSSDDEGTSSLSVASGGKSTKGAKRQKTGEKPEWLDATPVLSLAPLLTRLLEPADDLYKTTINFSRIYANRCIAGIRYTCLLYTSPSPRD